MIGFIVSGGISFLVVIFSTLIGVNFFKSRNIGQEIQEEVDFHDHKKGTPTMGGLFIVFGTLVGYTFSHINFWTIGEGFKVELTSININVFFIFGIALLMALVGFIDDFLNSISGKKIIVDMIEILLTMLFMLISFFTSGLTTF